MKFILLATLTAYALAVGFTSTAVTVTAAYTSGTKTNATCGLTLGVSGTLAVTASSAEYFGLWLSSTSAVTTTSASDYYITCNWQVASASTSTVATTFTTSPACTAYTSSGTAWVSNSTLTTSSSTITAAGTLSTMAALGFVFVNATTSNFTKTSLSLYNWVVMSEGSAAAWGTTASTTQTTIALSACTTGMAAIASSASQSSIISAVLAFSFF